MTAIDTLTAGALVYATTTTTLGVWLGIRCIKAERALVLLRDSRVSLSHKLSMARQAFLEADLDRRLARRRAARPQRVSASRKGWQTRRGKVA